MFRLFWAAGALALAASMPIEAPSITVEIDSATGMPTAVNTSYGFVSGLLSSSWLGEAPATVLSVAVQPCDSSFTGYTGGPPVPGAVCVLRSLAVTGQTPNGSCCAAYTVAARDVFEPVLPPSGAAGSVPGAVAWTFAVTDTVAAVPWRTRIATDVTFQALACNVSDAAYWAPHGGADNAGFTDGVSLLLGASQAPPLPLRTQYGRGFIYEAAVAAGREIMAVPITMSASLSADAGVSLLHDPRDAILAAYADVSPGNASFSRLYNRLGAGAATGKGAAAVFTTFIVPLSGADWRPAFAWARALLPSIFLSPSATATATAPAAEAAPHAALAAAAPASGATAATAAAAAGVPAPAAVAIGTPAPPPAWLQHGLGLYTCAQPEDYDMGFLSAAGVTVNWDASFWWPYIGMLLPPAPQWQSNIGPGEEADCGPHWSHGQITSRQRIDSSYAAGQQVGVSVFPYFNLFEFGENITILPPSVPPTPPSVAWQNATVFAVQNLTNATLCTNILPDGSCVAAGTGWQAGAVLDPGAPTWSAFLVSQVQDKLDSFKDNFRGLSVDRLDHNSQVNSNTYVGGSGWDVAWCGHTCRFLVTGFVETTAAIQALLAANPISDGTQRPLTANYNGAERVDLLQHFDGVFSEDEAGLEVLNTAGVSLTGKPIAILWTYSWQEVQTAMPAAGADGYMQAHLYMRMFPMAPVLGADHSIDNATAGGAGQQVYRDYGPLFQALIGSCWHLAPRPITITAAAADASASTTARAPAAAGRLLGNAYTVGGGCTSPGVAGGNGPVSTLVLFVWQPDGAVAGTAVTVGFTAPPGLDTGAALACSSITPGAGNWQPLQAPQPVSPGQYSAWAFAQPIALARGAVMIRCTTGSNDE